MLQHIDTLDAANRIGSRESLWRNNTTTQFVGTTTFSYDDQLTDEAHPSCGRSPDRATPPCCGRSPDRATPRDRQVSIPATQWQYDENGNRVQYSNGGFSRSYTTDGWHALRSSEGRADALGC